MPALGAAMPEEHREKIRAARLARPLPAFKKCPSCGETKPRTAFGARSKNPRWLRSLCRPCGAAKSRAAYHKYPELYKRHNDRNGIRRMGITPEEYETRLQEQGGLCAICEQPPGRKRLAIDHCHETGAIRGLLCGECNRALGFFYDDVVRLQAAIDYLGHSGGSR